RVEQLAANTAPPAVRREAIRTLGRLPTPRAVDVLQKLVRDGGPTAVVAVDALGQHAAGRGNQATAPPAVKALQEVLRDTTADPQTRTAAIVALADSRPGSAWLLAVYTTGDLPDSSLALKPDVVRLLRNSPFQ